MAFRCVYAACECTGCMGCFDDDDIDIPFDEEPLPEEDFEDDDEVEG